jgi:acetyl-CoA C-acetyltransferase
VVAGGMESMTNAPHMVNARTGIRYGDGKLVDHMAWDGLTNPYDGQSMGVFGELCADKYHFTREEQDAFVIGSVERAQAAQKNGAFADEIVPSPSAAARATYRSIPTSSPAVPTLPGFPVCGPPSARKTAASPPPAHRAFPTAPRPWCC